MKKFPDYVLPVPKVGADVYIRGSMSMSHGMDDMEGGLDKVIRVEEGISGGDPTHYVYTELRGTGYNWEYLARQQKELRGIYGDQRAFNDPDDRPQFNRWASAGDCVNGKIIDHNIV